MFCTRRHAPMSVAAATTAANRRAAERSAGSRSVMARECVRRPLFYTTVRACRRPGSRLRCGAMAAPDPERRSSRALIVIGAFALGGAAVAIALLSGGEKVEKPRAE